MVEWKRRQRVGRAGCPLKFGVRAPELEHMAE